MPIPQEICVFFPCHTLEDFPTHLRDDSAEGILAAWTAPWHPAVIAATGAIPTWHRADTPPVELKHRLLLIPSASESRLPSDLNGRMADAIDCHRISVSTREIAAKEIIQHLRDNRDTASDHNDWFNPSDLQVSSVSAEDFFALGYLALQVQVMTRKLRYSSNLDLVTFSEHIVAAAKAFCAGHESCEASLQSAFDLLAEERDHYFSSDPHMIDLILVAPTTLGPDLLNSLEGDAPLNLLMSAQAAQEIAANHQEIADRIRQRCQAETLSIVGGSPDDTSRLDYLGSSAVAGWLEESLTKTEAALGVRPVVFGRLGGGIPGDLPPWLISAGFRGAITNDFYSGVGWQDEPKMLWQSGGAELEALTAKPLDVLQPQTFINLGPKLGEIADAGQVSAALMVRWPGTDSTYLQDLRRASERTLALGKFWTLDRFFTHGERPYHSCTLPAVVADGIGLDSAVQEGVANPLSTVAMQFNESLRTEAAISCSTIARLVSQNTGSVQIETTQQPSLDDASKQLATALGFQTVNSNDSASSASKSSEALVLLNPHSGPVRGYGALSGEPPASNTPGLFGSSKSKSGSRVTVDIPGHGFASVKSSPSGTAKSSSKKGLLGLFSKPKTIAQGQSLSNEFLDVAIHPETGAVAAVHAGQQRGNRFSWQVALFDYAGPGGGYSAMRCKSLRVLASDTAEGIIEAHGDVTVDGKPVAKFINRYSLQQGSRWLEIESELTDLTVELSDQPWKNYFAGRATWATDALSIRPFVRDKRHRTSGKRIEAPLGVIIDEGDRKLQVCSYGLPAHRRIGTKELDTLLIVRGESQRKFRLAYGFDVPSPARSARQHLLPAIAVPVKPFANEPGRGWLLDIDSRSTIISRAAVVDSNTIELVIVESSGKPSKARISMFRDILSAKRKNTTDECELNEGAAIIRLSGHEVTTIQLKLA